MYVKLKVLLSSIAAYSLASELERWHCKPCMSLYIIIINDIYPFFFHKNYNYKNISTFWPLG